MAYFINENPEVSIITPAFNCSDTILDTYNSIKQQSFASWEWIVVEDNSSDDSYDIIKKIERLDSRVILLKTSHNMGAAAARNIGIDRAKGRFIAFLDADDMWKKEKLEIQIDYMKRNNCSFTFTDYDLLFPNLSMRERKTKRNIVTYKNLLKRNEIGCLTVVYDTKVLNKIYMPLDCEKREDHGAWLDITKKGYNAYKIPMSLSIYRVGEHTVSSNKFKMIKYQYKLYRIHEGFGVFKSLFYVLLCSFSKLLFNN